MSLESKKKGIQSRIKGIKILKFREENISNYGITKAELKKAQFTVSVKIETDPQASVINYFVRIESYLRENKERLDLFMIEYVYSFEIRYMKKKFGNAPEVSDFPINLVTDQLGMTLSGGRGMLFAKLHNSTYDQFILPVINHNQFIQSEFKKKNTKVAKKT